MKSKASTRFKAILRRPAALSDGDTPWAFVILPKPESDRLPRRGRTSIEGTINGRSFRATLEPDGQLSHWLKVDQRLLELANAAIGDDVMLEIVPVAHEPDPEMPDDVRSALTANPQAMAAWAETTTIARLDWIHWITSAKQSRTRAKRIDQTCDMLASGERRVCCFDSSGYYSKALRSPKEAR